MLMNALYSNHVLFRFSYNYIIRKKNRPTVNIAKVGVDRNAQVCTKIYFLFIFFPLPRSNVGWPVKWFLALYDHNQNKISCCDVGK